MHSRSVHRSLFAVLLLGSLQHAAPAFGEPVMVEPTGHEQPLFVIGVPTSLVGSVRLAIVELFGAEALDASLPLGAIDRLDGATLKRASIVIALGREGCADVVSAVNGARSSTPILCTLLYADAFNAIDCADACEHVTAIVMDQPPERQARIAATLFPALERFGILREKPQATLAPEIELKIFDSGRRLSGQLAELLVGVDAVVVEPRPGIYPPDGLRTVLLTAYGWDRPIVGYGPDWVRAGALISAYSTPQDLLSDVQDTLLSSGPMNDPGVSRERTPGRFHVAENVAIARSLGLRRMPLVIEGRGFDDRDFAR